MRLIGLPMDLFGVLYKELNFNCYCSKPNAENVTWPSLILVASLPWHLGDLRPSDPHRLERCRGASSHRLLPI